MKTKTQNNLSQVLSYALIIVSLHAYPFQDAYAKNKLYYYEPEITTLEGTLITKTVNGHCDILNDKFEKPTKEICPFLILDKPIDVAKPITYSKTPPAKRDFPEKNIEILQISNTGHVDFNFKSDERVRLTGVLFRHHSSCNYTRVLIDIDEIAKLSI